MNDEANTELEDELIEQLVGDGVTWADLPDGMRNDQIPDGLTHDGQPAQSEES